MKAWAQAGTLAAAAALAACGAGDQQEVQQWMQAQRAQIKPRVQPIAEPKPFQPQAYEAEAAPDPFGAQKLAQVLKSDAQAVGASAAKVAPELQRRKEPLESFPLDTMTMVGSLAREGQTVALIQVENLLYQVRVGNHLGQNYGRILRVTDSEVVLRELVQDGAGEWVERTATLQLQEKAK